MTVEQVGIVSDCLLRTSMRQTSSVVAARAPTTSCGRRNLFQEVAAGCASQEKPALKGTGMRRHVKPAATRLVGLSWQHQNIQVRFHNTYVCPPGAAADASRRARGCRAAGSFSASSTSSRPVRGCRIARLDGAGHADSRRHGARGDGGRRAGVGAGRASLHPTHGRPWSLHGLGSCGLVALDGWRMCGYVVGRSRPGRAGGRQSTEVGCDGFVFGKELSLARANRIHRRTSPASR